MSHKNQSIKKRRIVCLLLVILLVISLAGTITSKREAKGLNLAQIKVGQEQFRNREANFNSSQLICLESEIGRAHV